MHNSSSYACYATCQSSYSLMSNVPNMFLACCALETEQNNLETQENIEVTTLVDKAHYVSSLSQKSCLHIKISNYCHKTAASGECAS